MSLPIPKMITDAVCVISSAWETVRFLTTVDVVLEKYDNCLPNNRWLCVNHVLIVFG